MKNNNSSNHSDRSAHLKQASEQAPIFYQSLPMAISIQLFPSERVAWSVTFHWTRNYSNYAFSPLSNPRSSPRIRRLCLTFCTPPQRNLIKIPFPQFVESQFSASIKKTNTSKEKKRRESIWLWKPPEPDQRLHTRHTGDWFSSSSDWVFNMSWLPVVTARIRSFIITFAATILSSFVRLKPSHKTAFPTLSTFILPSLLSAEGEERKT